MLEHLDQVLVEVAASTLALPEARWSPLADAVGERRQTLWPWRIGS